MYRKLTRMLLLLSPLRAAFEAAPSVYQWLGYPDRMVADFVDAPHVDPG